MKVGRKPLDLTGRTFGTLRPLKRLAKRDAAGGCLWMCFCDPALGGCGGRVARSGSGLPRRKSCGCLDGRYDHRPSHNADRNAEIYERWQGSDEQESESCSLLADEYFVTRQRICQIVAEEARRRGEALRGGHAGIFKGEPGRRFTPIDPDLMDAVRKGEISAQDAAEQVGLKRSTMVKRILSDGQGVMDAKIRRAAALNAEVYAKFMAGKQQGELADEYGTTPGCINQRILRHRRRTGDPAKRPHKNGVGT